MSRHTSPYIVGNFWLDKRRDGKSPETWQIARSCKRSIVYRSTHHRRLEDAKACLEAHVAEQRSLERQEPREAKVLPLILTYWKEHGRKRINHDQTGRSIRTFIGFLIQDRSGAQAVVIDLNPALFERFREWRMGAHDFDLTWGGKAVSYSSPGVSGATVQRNVNDVRAAVNYARDNQRIPTAPKIRDLDVRFRSAPRDRVLSMEEMAKIAWYASHNADLFRFVTLQFATAVRPAAALKFNPALQYRDGLIDLQPGADPQTKKRNAIIPAIRPMKPVLEAWAKAGAKPVQSRKTAWQIMRRALGLSDDVHPKTIRHTISTLLYADETVPEREIVEMLGHEGKLARTTRIYAKYNPRRLGNLTSSLSRLWLQVSREARRFGADHSLTNGQRGHAFAVVTRSNIS